MAFEHHLGLDGAGYPRVVNARKPDLFSRICSIADAFEYLGSQFNSGVASFELLFRFVILRRRKNLYQGQEILRFDAGSPGIWKCILIWKVNHKLDPAQ